jgi:GDPmannose 4,6-dehydratase
MGLSTRVRFYQASTSELYGSSEPPQSEVTPFMPRSPYAIAKLYAYHIVKNYREAYGLYAVNGILFNHESERRGESFVSRKITRAVAAVYHDKEAPVLSMGNMYAYRDWGHAEDYVQAMWQMLQPEHPDDYVIATGESYTVKEFIEEAFGQIGVKIAWEGTGIEEKGYDTSTGNLLVRVDPKFFRQTEVHHLRGNASKARERLGWQPSICFKDLVHRMVQYDILEHGGSRNLS